MAVDAAAGYLQGKAFNAASVMDNVVVRMIGYGLGGAATGGGQQLGENAVAKATIDPDRHLLQGVKEAALIGGITSVFQGVVHETVKWGGRAEIGEAVSQGASKIKQGLQAVAKFPKAVMGELEGGPPPASIMSLGGGQGSLSQVARIAKAVSAAVDKMWAPAEQTTTSNAAKNAGAKSELSQAGGLTATEGDRVAKPGGGQSKPTHPLTKHGPDVSEQYLKDRVQAELVGKGKTGIRTKFDERATMESAVKWIKDNNHAQINAWLQSNPPAGATQGFKGNPQMGNLGTGFEVTTPGGPIIKVQRSLDNVNLVLISDGHGGYLIHTAHPE